MIRFVLTLLLLPVLLFLHVAAPVVIEIPLRLMFGCFSFLRTVLPRLAIDSSAVLSGVAVVFLLFAAIHVVTRSLWMRQTSSARPWKTSLKTTLAVLILFPAGTAFVGLARHGVSFAMTDGILINNARETVHRVHSKNQLKQIAIAIKNYQDSTGTFPPGGTFDEAGQGLHSWVTHLLPYLDEEPLSRKIVWQHPWNHQANQSAMRYQIQTLIRPGMREMSADDFNGRGISHYATNVRMLGANSRIRSEDITDGHSNTILAGEVASGIRAWGDPANWRDPARGINTADGFSSPSAKGVNVLFADGSTRFLSSSISPQVLRAISTPRGGESEEAHEIAVTDFGGIK